ncbi:MAG: helix-turn-helix domain-containing protein [Marinagarivorans sp.]|nr:helix-turn-helix domain-containing protein [Marinagarivorans sp.]
MLDGEKAAAVARSYGLGDRTIYVWMKKYREEGFDGLEPIERTGRNRKLSDVEEQEVKRWILGGDPRQHGFDFGLWTRQIVSNLIADRFGIDLSVTSTGELLHRLDLTPQKHCAELMSVMRKRLQSGKKKNTRNSKRS